MSRQVEIRTMLWTACLALAAGLLNAALGQTAPEGGGVLEDILPALRTAPAPGWARPGTQLTFHGGVAIIPASGEYFYKDPDGGWVDKAGNRYRREEASGHGAEGYTQVTIAYMDSRTAALDVRGYAPVRLGGPLVQNLADCAVGSPGAPGDWWVSPQILQKVTEQQTANFVSIRMPYKIKNQTYQAIRFQYQDGHSRHVSVYDLASGVLLHSSVNVSSQYDDSGRGGTMIAHNTFMGIRQLNIPWAGQAAPQWVNTLRTMDYSGANDVVVPNASSLQIPGQLQLQVLRRGQGWLQYRATASFKTIDGMPPTTGSVTRISGPYQFAGLWIPPAAMGTLRQGQVLDQDPYTQITTKVTHVGRLGSFENVVVISEVGHAQRIDNAYDVGTGMLVYVHQDKSYEYQDVKFWLTNFR